MTMATDHDHPETGKLEQLHRQLLDAVSTLETGEQWQAWLRFASGFHRYSFNNIMLIWSQLPSATLVASYRTWHAKGRQVRKGEHALRVLAPNLRSEPLLDSDGKPILDDDGTPRRWQRVAGYLPVPVFDISQTDGPPDPEPVRPVLLNGAAPAGLWNLLAEEAAQRGYRLLRGTMADLDGANGRTHFDTREIWVRHDVDDAQAVKTLAHELGHVLLHGDANNVPCAGIREVEAESVAYLFTAAHGMATDDYTFPYVAAWAQTRAEAEHLPLTTIVGRTGTRVMQAALTLIEATNPQPDPAVTAIAERVIRQATRTAELRDQASAAVAQTHTRDELDTLRGVLADSQHYFRQQATTSWVPAYLRHRGLAEALDSHGLGYAPAGWTTLIDHLASLGYRDDHIEAAGMATRTRHGRLIDRFRDRLTIPVPDEHGRLVGFVGRTGPEQAEDDYHPRYLNSPRTPLYVKGQTLLGLDRLGDSKLLPVLCEGPLDAIAVDLTARQAGWPYVGIATGGTAFTDTQARLLTAHSKERPICLLFDPDEAGEKAAQAAWLKLTAVQPRAISLAALPAGSDPADLLERGQGKLLADLVAHAGPAAERICDVRIERSGVDDHCVRRLAAFRILLDYADRVPPSERGHFIGHLAQRLDIDATVVQETLAEKAGTASPGRLLDSEPATTGIDSRPVRLELTDSRPTSTQPLHAPRV